MEAQYEKREEAMPSTEKPLSETAGDIEILDREGKNTTVITSKHHGNNVSQEVSDYMRSLATRSHKAVREKYGKDYYKTIVNKRWANYRRLKGEQEEEKELVIKYTE